MRADRECRKQGAKSLPEDQAGRATSILKLTLFRAKRNNRIDARGAARRKERRRRGDGDEQRGDGAERRRIA